MARTAEFYRDPDTPAATGLLPAAYAVVRDDIGRVLLVRRADDLNWELPGGRIDVGESAAQAAVREVGEEAGIDIELVALAGVYSDPEHVLVYADDGPLQQLAVCFHARPTPRSAMAVRPAPQPDQVETIDVAWVHPAETEQLVMHPAVRVRLADAVARPHRTHFD